MTLAEVIEALSTKTDAELARVAYHLAGAHPDDVPRALASLEAPAHIITVELVAKADEIRADLEAMTA